jgi:hypothetical protein
MRSRYLQLALPLVILCVGCNDTTAFISATGPSPFVVGAALFTTDVAPLPLVIYPVGNGPFCGGGGLKTRFDFAVANNGRRDLFLDHVTVHMIDGTNLGGPAVPVPEPGVTAAHATLVKRGARRVFRFEQQFRCGVVPTSVLIRAGLRDELGAYTSQLNAAVR